MSSNAERLAEAVIARRKELGDISQLDVYLAGGPSNTTMTEVENGRLKTLTRTTANKLDAGLRWEQGSARRVWDGKGEPVPIRLSHQSPREARRVREFLEATEDVDQETREALLRVLDERGAS